MHPERRHGQRHEPLQRLSHFYNRNRSNFGAHPHLIGYGGVSLCLVLPKVYELLSDTGECVALIKPQFEAGRDKVGKKGVVREKSTHIEVVEKIIGFAKELGFTVRGLDFSPIKGPEGNIEYLLYISKVKGEHTEVSPADTVDASHAELDK